MLKSTANSTMNILIPVLRSVVEFGWIADCRRNHGLIDNGGNVLVAVFPKRAISARSPEVGFETDEEGAAVIDISTLTPDQGCRRQTYGRRRGPANLNQGAWPFASVPRHRLLRVVPGHPVSLWITRILLVMELLTASSSAYSHNPDEPITEYPYAVGKNVV